ncbi:MAG: nuclear transport factor 2 family protein [Gammaproteobacteria bacterium]
MDALARYVAFLESFDAAALPLLGEVYAANVHFRDPFNDVRGLAALERVYADMLAQVGELRFRVRASAWSGTDGAHPVALLRWTLDGELRAFGNRAWTVDGCSEVHFDTSGLVIAHHDYWDAAGGLYAHLPVLGPLVRWLSRRLAAH